MGWEVGPTMSESSKRQRTTTTKTKTKKEVRYGWLYGSSTQKKRQRFPAAKATASSMRRCDRDCWFLPFLLLPRSQGGLKRQISESATMYGSVCTVCQSVAACDMPISGWITVVFLWE